jgi:hypothetical protein
MHTLCVPRNLGADNTGGIGHFLGAANLTDMLLIKPLNLKGAD